MENSQGNRMLAAPCLAEFIERRAARARQAGSYVGRQGSPAWLPDLRLHQRDNRPVRRLRKCPNTPGCDMSHPHSCEAPRLHDADWLADLLGVSRQRAYALAREGLVPCVRIGRRIRFNEQAIIRWIEKGGCAEPLQT